jgi:deoxycytidine triphosphate deaminase
MLSGPEIERLTKVGNPENPNGEPDIIITPFNPECVGANSYDIHLDKVLKVYKNTLPEGMVPWIIYEPGKKYSMRDWFVDNAAYQRFRADPAAFDIRNPELMLNPFEGNKETIEIEIPDAGLILSPFVGYLGATMEWTKTTRIVPCIDGKSSTGRYFVKVHFSAGFGDDGFNGKWTLEIETRYPFLVRPGMRIGQLHYHKMDGERKPYDKNPRSHYWGKDSAVGAAGIAVDGRPAE